MTNTPPAPEGLSSNQTICLALLIGFSFGTVGLLALALMVWLSHQRVGVDRSAKHGISTRNTSRLGGLGIALFLGIVWASSSFEQVGLWSDFRLVVALREPPVWVWPVLCVGLIGLVDDLGLKSNLGLGSR